MKTNFRSYIGLIGSGVLAWSTLAHASSITPSLFVPGDKTIRLASGDQLTPEIAAGGSTFLAVWQDKRAFPTSLPSSALEWETSSDIYAMRIDANGKALDSVPIVVTQEAASQKKPQVVWNGTNWLVVFESIDINGTGFYYDDSLEAVRISPAGVVLDPKPIKIRNVSPAGTSWSVASDGIDWVIAFQESDASSALALLRLTAAGQVLQGPKVIVPSTYFLRSDLKLAYANGVFLFTWGEFSDTQAIRFDSSLTLLNPVPFRLLTGHLLSDLTSSGTQFCAVWIQAPTFVDQVAGSRISTAGVLLDGAGDVVSGNNTPDAFTPTAVSWDGTNFKVTWSSKSKLYLARVSADGSVLDPGGILIPGPRSGPTASTGAGNLQVVWSVFQKNEYDTLSANISSSNVAGRNLSTGSGAPAQTRSDVAMGASGSMIVFRSDFSGTNRIMVQPLDPNGVALTRGPIQLATGATTNGPGTPSVAWNGAVYLATWSSSTGIVAQRINQDGSVVDPAPFSVMPGFGPTEVSALADTFLVIARQFVNSNPEVIVPVVSRVNGTTGAVLDPAGIVVGNSFCVSVSVTTVGDRWLAAFRSNTTHDNPVGSTYGNFVNADGTKGAAFVVYGPYSTAGNGIAEVAVASDGTNSLVLQSAPLTTTSETDLVGVIVKPDGTHNPAVNLTPWMGNQYSPRVAWNGVNYVAVFNDQVNRFAPFTLDQLDARSDLFGMRIAADGTKIDLMGFVFSALPMAESWPNVTGGNGATLITGSVMRALRFDAYRVGYQLYSGDQWPVAVASANSEGGDTPLAVTFDSTGSTDLDGSIVSYLWDFGDGSTSTLANPQHTYTVPGNYVVILTVTDNLGVATTNTVSLAVTAPNQIPVAKFVVIPPTGPAPLSIVLTSDESYDPDGAVGNREWTFSDGGTYYGNTAYHTFSRSGTYTVTLTVYDNRGAKGSSMQTVVAQ
jgi:PKD repeat protein